MAHLSSISAIRKWWLLILLSVSTFEFGSGLFSNVGTTDTLVSSGQNSLTPGQCLYSSYGLYELCYQSNGVLNGYDYNGIGFFSQIGTGYSPRNCIIQGDGNFVCYDTGNGVKYATGTNRGVSYAPYRFALQSDRNIVLLDNVNTVLWASGTNVAIQCSDGYYLSGSSCAQCSAGTYSTYGTNTCSSCAAGKVSWAGAASCMDYPTVTPTCKYTLTCTFYCIE